MRLFLNESEGTGMIACPACGLPLLLAAERRGRWVVGYQHLHLRIGRTAKLVCPDLACDHWEPVVIAGTPDDAVVYSSGSAASLWRMTAWEPDETLGEIHKRLLYIQAIYRKTGTPKAPSAFRFWRDQYRFLCSGVIPELKYGMKHNEELILEGRERSERGRVIELLPDSVLLDRSENHETVLVPFGDLRQVSRYIPEVMHHPRHRLDFHDESDLWKRNHCVNRTTQFAMVSGHKVELYSVSRHGECLIETSDAVVAKALGIRLRVDDRYRALVPAGFIDRCYKSVRWCYVRGHRLELHAATVLPDVYQLRTRSLEVARELKMRYSWSWFGIVDTRERNQMRWWKFFHQSEIERTEEKQIPLDISKLVRLQEVRHRKAEAQRVRDDAEWAAMEAEDAAYEDDDEDGDEDESEDEE
ncbi:MAG: hypothetical protein K0R39_682 [Symbiobacteriaceae bacterium]|jgi:hypothetical protein|nr:hypothetical protein [Symbiobacteriaceae bacterium]